jgi:hypothetical protein
MAQTYTLEEAADKLNLSIEEFKRRLRTEWTQIRSFRDGATLRFRANEIDELARTYGLGSSDEMPLAESSPLDVPDDIGLAPKAKAKGDSGAPLNLDDSSEEAFALAPDAGSGSKSSKSKKGDSDVRLEGSDKKKAASADDEESILTEELELPSAGGSSKLSGKSGKLSSAKLKGGDSGKQKTGSSGKQKKSDSSGKQKAAPPPADDSSEFELTLDADSDEFELSLTQDSSDEVSLGDMPASTPAGKSGQSGINLNRPADSGVSLENKRKGDDDEIDFELSLDAPGSGMSSRKNLAGSGSKSGSKASGKSSGKGSGKQAKQPDSDSEFELSLEEPSDSGLDLEPAGDKKGDIFEATDFEIPALDDDSASEAVSLDDSDTDVESSDFDLALDDADADADDESASQVVALDDDEAPAKSRKRKRTDDDDDDVDLDDGFAVSRERDEDEEPATVAAAAEWGPWPAVMMFPTLIVLFIGTIMAYEVLHSMWGYQQGSQTGTPLVNFMAEKLDMKPAQ